MNQNIGNTESEIRIIHFFRRIGSIAVIIIIFSLLFFSVYHQRNNKIILSDLKYIDENGSSKLVSSSKIYHY